MAESVTIRSVQSDDFDAIARLYVHHWCNNVPNAEDKLLAGRHCVIIQLVRSPVAMVAEQNGDVVGVCLGCVVEDGVAPTVTRWQPMHEAVHAAAVARAETADANLEGSLFGDQRELEKADRFIKTNSSYAQAQITLFMVEPHRKGRGIGTRLFEAVCARLREGGARAFFLMTDTESDFAYYEHRGMRCLERYPDDPCDPDSWAALLYGGEL